MKKLLIAAGAIAVALVGSADAWRKGNGGREDPIVASGVTISANLDANSANNIDGTTSLTNAFSTSIGSPTVTVSWTAHGMTAGQRVTFYNSSTVGGLNMDRGWVIATASTNSFTFTHTSNANANAGPTGSTIASNVQTDLDGKIRFLCKFSHLSYNDPILFPGVHSATHLHLFFGNTLTDENSTYASLRATGDGTCDGGPLNRTAYWMPAMIDSSVNQVRIPIDFQWYYAIDRPKLSDITSPVCALAPGSRNLQDGRPAACPQYAIKKLERGNKAVFGYKVSALDFPSTYAGHDPLATSWTCQTSGGGVIAGTYRYLHHRTTASLGLSSNTNCPSSGIVSLRVGNPTCWNGSHSGEFENFAWNGTDGYAPYVGYTGELCPATHPYAFLQFTVIATWSYTGGISSVSTWYLSSDRHNGGNFEPGETFHWDMWWAWEDAILDHMHNNILGMNPNSASTTTAAGGPYLYSTFGSTADAAAWTSGPFIRNTNNGGLSGNAGVGDCTALGMAGSCSLKAHTSGAYSGVTMLSDQLVNIPTP